MSDRDAEAFHQYEDDARPEPTPGPASRRREQTLAQHVPVRFPASTVETVRELAEADGMSVSAWIRHTVDEVVAKRAAPEPATETDARAAGEQQQRDP